MANMEVSGAGTSDANGTYTEVDTYNGKPRYYNDTYYIYWFVDPRGGDYWKIGTTLYRDNDLLDVATPDLVEEWFTVSGTPPAPTVTAGNDYTLTCDAGALSLTGTNASLLASRILSAEAGAFALSGTDAGLFADRILSAEAGTIILSGTDAGLQYNRIMGCDAGALVLSGVDIGLFANRVLSADAGALILTGTDIAFVYGRILVCDGGVLLLTGIDANLWFIPPTPACRIYTIPAESRTLTVETLVSTVTLPTWRYWGDSYWGLYYWSTYWGFPLTTIYGTPNERTFVIEAETRTMTITCTN
jgi:hypothetical protein